MIAEIKAAWKSIPFNTRGEICAIVLFVACWVAVGIGYVLTS